MTSFSTVLRWQLQQADALDPQICELGWARAKKRQDIPGMLLVLSRKDCPERVVGAALSVRSPQVRVAVLTRPELSDEQIAEVLTGEQRAGVLAELLGNQRLKERVLAQSETAFQAKPTVALAEVLVGVPEASSAVRLQACELLWARGTKLDDRIVSMIRSLPGALSGDELARYCRLAPKASYLRAALQTLRVPLEAQQRVAHHLISGALERAAGDSWGKNKHVLAAGEALKLCALLAEYSPALVEIAAKAEATGLLDATGLEAARTLQGGGGTGVTLSYAERASAAVAAVNAAEAYALVADAQCPDEVVVGLLPVLLRVASVETGLGEAIARRRAGGGSERVLRELLLAAPGPTAALLGFDQAENPAAMRAEVLGMCRTQDLPGLVRAGHVDEVSVRDLSWAAVVGYATRSWQDPSAGALSRMVARAQVAALGESRAAWEVVEQLGEGFTGSVGELLDTSAAVLQE